MHAPLRERAQQLALALRVVMLGAGERGVPGSDGFVERQGAIPRQAAHHHQPRGPLLVLADKALLVADRPDPAAGAGPRGGDRGRRRDGGQLRAQAGKPRLYGSQVLFGQ